MHERSTCCSHRFCLKDLSRALALIEWIPMINLLFKFAKMPWSGNQMKRRERSKREDRWIFQIKLRNFRRITVIHHSRWWMKSRSSSTRHKMIILLSRRTRFIIVSVSLSIVKKINSKSNEQKQWSLAAISSITSTNRILSIHVRCFHLSSFNTDSWASNGAHNTRRRTGISSNDR